MFKYRKFWMLQAQSIVLSIPQIVTGYLCIDYLEFEMDDVQCFYIGLACSNFLTPLMVDVTRFKLMFINSLMLTVGIIGLSTEDYTTITGYSIYISIIGVIVGCDWLLTIKYIREQVGWEESRSIYINNNPYIFFFLGSMIRIGYLKQSQPPQNEQIIVSILIILTNSIRLLSLSGIFGKQSLEYYYRKFKELQGRVIIRELYSGDTKEIEYFYISNNEANSKLNLSTKALLTKNYKKRFICCSLLALLSWIQLNNHIPVQNLNELVAHPYYYFIPAILTLTALTPIVYRYFHIRDVMFVLNILLLILNTLQLIKFRVLWIKEHEIYIYFPMVLIYIAYFIGLNMLLTQQLPYKGITYCLNLTFVSMLISDAVESMIKNHDQKCFRFFEYSYVSANILCMPILMQLKSIRQFREYEIQQIYT